VAIASGAATAARLFGLLPGRYRRDAAIRPFARTSRSCRWLLVRHIAYGLEFLSGILRLAGRETGAAAPARFFTALTR